MNGVQTGLDVVGLIPGAGEIADGANALISLGRGDYKGAALSGAAMIPFAGWGATGAKLAGKFGDVGGLVIGKMDDLGKSTGWRVGDHTLHLPPLPPGPGRWEQNARELQHAIDQGRPIRDVSPTQGGGFLERERALLQQNSWRFDPQTSTWSPGG